MSAVVVATVIVVCFIAGIMGMWWASFILVPLGSKTAANYDLRAIEEKT